MLYWKKKIRVQRIINYSVFQLCIDTLALLYHKHIPITSFHKFSVIIKCKERADHFNICSSLASLKYFVFTSVR